MASLPGIRVDPMVPMRPLPRLPLLDSYLVRELAGPFVFALGAFLLFWFLNIFFLAADYIINAHAPFFVVFRFLLFRIPQSTPYAFPFETFEYSEGWLGDYFQVAARRAP